MAASSSSSTSSCALAAPQGITPLGLALLVQNLANESRRVYGMSTWEVKTRCVLPTTAAKQQSAVDWLLDRLPVGVCASNVVGPANVFVSHAYDSLFSSTVTALRKWAKQHQATSSSPSSSSSVTRSMPSDGVFFYLDVLVENQHASSSSSAVEAFEGLRDTLDSRVRTVGHTVLVLDGSDATALRRSWCLFEMYTTLAAGAKLDIALLPETEAEFREELLYSFGKLRRRLCSVDVARAEAREAEDKASVHRMMEESEHGMLGASQVVSRHMTEWLVTQGLAALEEAVPATRQEHFDFACLQDSIGKAEQDLGRWVEAEAMHRAASSRVSSLNGKDDPHAPRFQHNLAAALMVQGNHSESEALLRNVIALRKRVFGPFHPDTLNSVLHLGTVLGSQSKDDEAETMFFGVLQGRGKSLGDCDPIIASATVQLVSSLTHRGKLSEAEALIRDAWNRSTKSLGHEHPMTLQSARDVASFWLTVGRGSEAEALLRDVLVKQMRVEGTGHIDTARTSHELGALLARRGELAEAEALLEAATSARRRMLGAEHVDTQASRTALLAVQRRLSDAGRASDGKRRRPASSSDCASKRDRPRGPDGMMH